MSEQHWQDALLDITFRIPHSMSNNGQYAVHIRPIR